MDIEQVKAWLKANNMTQKELAERLGVSPITVNKWLKGTLGMSASSQVALDLLMHGGEPATPAEPVQDWLIKFDEDVWRRLKFEADKHGVTPREMASRLACRLADALAENWCKAHQERENQAADEPTMPSLSVMPTPYMANGGIAAHGNGGNITC